MAQQREKSGILFRNDKRGVEKRPDYRGEITIEGVTYRLAGWIKEGKKGNFLSLAASVPSAEQSATPTQDSAPTGDDIPF